MPSALRAPARSLAHLRWRRARRRNTWESRGRRRRVALVVAASVIGTIPSAGVLSPSPLVTQPVRSPVIRDELAVARTADPLGVAGGDRVIPPPPARFDAAPSPPAAPPFQLRPGWVAGPPAGGVWAVIIGIDDYPGSRFDLRASVNDASDVDAALAAYGVASDRRLVLRNTQADARTITDTLRWLVARASADATAVVFFAGHVRKLGAGSEAIVAADGGVVADVEVADLLRPLAARRAWIALASCYSGGFTEVLAPGRILTAASDASSLAYENEAYGRSYLVEYMVRRAMLQAEAPATVEEAFAWAADRLRAEHPDRVPVQYDQLDGELRLGPAPAAPAPPARPPPSSAGRNDPGSPSSPPPQEPEPTEDDDPCLLSVGSLVGCGE